MATEKQEGRTNVSNSSKKRATDALTEEGRQKVVSECIAALRAKVRDLDKMLDDLAHGSQHLQTYPLIIEACRILLDVTKRNPAEV